MDNPIPALVSVSPGRFAAGSTFQSLTLTGRNFLSSSQVRFNGVRRTATFVSPSRLTIRLTAADLKSAGSYPVVVVNPPPGGGTSSVVSVLIEPAPRLSPEGQ